MAKNYSTILNPKISKSRNSEFTKKQKDKPWVKDSALSTFPDCKLSALDWGFEIQNENIFATQSDFGGVPPPNSNCVTASTNQ